MTWESVGKRPDLRPLFGSLSAEEHEQLLDGLLAIDRDLVDLAERASAHVGVPYEAIGLQLHTRDDGTSAGIDGGPSGDAGDIWFDVSPADGCVGPPWIVESRFIVFCTDSPEPRGVSNTHELVRLEASAGSAAGVVDALEHHVRTMGLEMSARPRELFTKTPHSELP